MLEYRPWSKEELYKSFNRYRAGEFSILDIELSGQCNFNCMYCDSPQHEKEYFVDIGHIEKILSSKMFEWIFICGLGEPTIGGNYRSLMEILELCRKYGVKCSIFSNISILTDEMLDYIDADILYILFKFDSFNFSMNANLYGTSNQEAKRQNQNIRKISQHVHCSDNMTNIGASIVPTRLNFDDIPQIVKYCIENSIYPLVADLENSGRGQDHFAALALSQEEIVHLRSQVEEIMGDKYDIPICPAVVSGIHINNDSYVVVDERSGLTCPWFWLEEPQYHTIVKLTDDISLEEIEKMIVDFRNIKLSAVKKVISSYTGDEKHNFGGCGGDIETLLNMYYDIQNMKGGDF